MVIKGLKGIQEVKGYKVKKVIKVKREIQVHKVFKGKGEKQEMESLLSPTIT